MGLMTLLNEVQGVFNMLTSVYEAFPVAIKLLIMAAFGGMLYISVLRSIWR